MTHETRTAAHRRPAFDARFASQNSAAHRRNRFAGTDSRDVGRPNVGAGSWSSGLFSVFGFALKRAPELGRHHIHAVHHRGAVRTWFRSRASRFANLETRTLILNPRHERTALCRRRVRP